MPDQETDVELPVEDAVEQEHATVPELGDAGTVASADSAVGTLEVDEADYAEQQSVVGYDDEDYR